MMVFPAPKSVRPRQWQVYILLPFPIDSWLHTKERVIDSPQISALFWHSNNNEFTLQSWAPLTIRIFGFIQWTFTPMAAVWAEDTMGIPGCLHSRHTVTPLGWQQGLKPTLFFHHYQTQLQAALSLFPQTTAEQFPLTPTLAPAHLTLSSPWSLRLFWLSLFTVCYKVRHYLNTTVTGRYLSHAGPHGNIWAEPWQGYLLMCLLVFRVISFAELTDENISLESLLQTGLLH